MENNICFNLAIRKQSRLITKMYEEKLSNVGLKSGQFSLLRAITLKKVTNNRELQDLLAMEQTTLTRNLKPLERDGYVIISIDEKDKRVKKISLSASGIKLYEKALPLWKGAQSELIKKIGQDEANSIVTMSRLFVSALS
jgi:DNA-binding MarR family transcriptional regulator